MDDGAEIVLGAGEMMVQTMRNGAAATVLFPTGCAELFALSMAPKQITQEMPDFLRKIGFSAEDFYDEVATRPRLVMAAHSLRTSFFYANFWHAASTAPDLFGMEGAGNSLADSALYVGADFAAGTLYTPC